MLHKIINFFLLNQKEEGRTVKTTGLTSDAGENSNDERRKVA